MFPFFVFYFELILFSFFCCCCYCYCCCLFVSIPGYLQEMLCLLKIHLVNKIFILDSLFPSPHHLTLPCLRLTCILNLFFSCSLLLLLLLLLWLLLLFLCELRQPLTKYVFVHPSSHTLHSTIYRQRSNYKQDTVTEHKDNSERERERECCFFLYQRLFSL